MSDFRKMFHFNKHDRDALIVLMIVIVAGVVLFPLLSDKASDGTEKSRKEYAKGEYGKKNREPFAQPDIGYGDGSKAVTDRNNGKLNPFPFDPNTADSTQLLRLGLKAWQVRNIYKYRAKGGVYRTPTDFAKLYGLTVEQYRQLEPYIRIAETPQQQYARDVIAPQNTYVSNKLKKGEKVDVNTADTTLLKRIPGIGSYFARRIVETRQRRGAITDASQLLSIKNFPETALEYMTISNTKAAATTGNSAEKVIEKIKINRMSQKELQKHPMLNYVQARDIFNLRRLTGNISPAQDLSCISSISPEQLKSLAPYLDFE